MISITLLPTTSQPAAAEGADGQPLPQPVPFASGALAGEPQPTFDLASFGEAMASSAPEEAVVAEPDAERPADETSARPEVELALAGQWLQGALEQRNAVVEIRGDGPERTDRGLDAARGLERLAAGGDSARWLTTPLMPSAGTLGAPLLGDGPLLTEAAFASTSAPRPGTAPLPAGVMEVQTLPTAATGGQTSGSATIEHSLKLGGAEPKWGQQMLHAVRNSIDVQVRQGVQNASIRLDPPELGRLDISVTTENGRLSVQISAAHGDVARLLHQTSERLRHELMGENFVHVDVQVASDNQQGRDGQSQPRTVTAFGDAAIGINGAEAAVENSAPPRPTASDVLVTV